MIKLFAPHVPKDAGFNLSLTLKSGMITQGCMVDEFEKQFSRKFRIPFPVSVNSGTSALEMAYELIGIGPGDEVITTPLTCAATNIPLLRLGAKIVWADIRRDTLNIDPWDVQSKITDKTKAIVQVHLGGIQADVGKVHVPVVSDACQALGIFSGDYTCCSFQAIKHITTGDGGMLIVNNAPEYLKAKKMRWFGIDRDRVVLEDWTSYRTRMMSFDIDLAGSKKHMNDLDATLGVCGLQSYDSVLAHRKKIFTMYKTRLTKIGGIWIVDGRVNVYWLATLLVDRRDDFARMLYENGVETNLVQVRNDTYKIFGGQKAELPVLEAVEDCYISIPLGMHISEDDADHICSLIEKGW